MKGEKTNIQTINKTIDHLKKRFQIKNQQMTKRKHVKEVKMKQDIRGYLIKNSNKKSKKIKRGKNNLIRENKRYEQKYFRARNPEYNEKIYKK